MNENIQFFNSQEAAKILGVNVSTIKRWTDEGKMECIKSAGGHRKFLINHLADFLKLNKKKISRINLFPLENRTDLEISHHILKGDFDFLVGHVLQEANNCNRESVQQVLNGLYLGQYPLCDIYDHLVTPVLYHIGENWRSDAVSIMEEHLATQTIRDCIVRLQGIISVPKKKVGSVLCMNPALELHDVALKMVDHILEVKGFRILFSGQITPTLEIGKIFERFHPDRLYVSSTMVPDQAAFQEEFDHLCEACEQNEIDVFIGGQGFDFIRYDHPAVVTRLKTFESVYLS